MLILCQCFCEGVRRIVVGVDVVVPDDHTGMQVSVDVIALVYVLRAGALVIPVMMCVKAPCESAYMGNSSSVWPSS